MYRVKEIQSVYKPGVRVASKVVDSPKIAAEVFQELIQFKTQEHFVVILLNSRNVMIKYSTITIGTMTESIVHPREIFWPAVYEKAASVIMCHNHPSGELSPSAEDKATTKRIVEAGNVLGISVLDHIIVSSEGWYSMKENGDMV